MNRYKKSEMPLELEGTDLASMKAQCDFCGRYPVLGLFFALLRVLFLEIKSSNLN